VPSALRTGALPLDAGKRQAHHLRAHVPRVLWTQLQYFTWPRSCHERFGTLSESADERTWQRWTHRRRWDQDYRRLTRTGSVGQTELRAGETRHGDVKEDEIDVTVQGNREHRRSLSRV
jgi:hypothetical protein